MTEPVAVKVEGLVKRYGRWSPWTGLSFSIARRTDHGAAGAQRCGQDHHHCHAAGPAGPIAGAIRDPGRADAEAGERSVLPRMNFSSPYVDLPQRLTVRQNLRVYADLYGVAKDRQRIAELASDSTSAPSSIGRRAAVGRAEDPGRCWPRR